MDFEILRGRWYARRTDESVDVERYLDVNEELLFEAVHFRRGAGPFRSRQSVLSIEKLTPAGDAQFEVDASVARWIVDGADQSVEEGGKLVRGRCRVEPGVLLLSFAEPDAPRPKDLSRAERFERRETKAQP